MPIKKLKIFLKKSKLLSDKDFFSTERQFC